MAQPQQQMRKPKETGVPDNKQYMHPTLLANYGRWKYHDRPRPGVLHHVAHSGDELWTVRAGTQRQLDVFTVRKLCDIADNYADGHVRFTIRSNICLLYTSDAADDLLCVDLGGRRIIKKQKQTKQQNTTHT